MNYPFTESSCFTFQLKRMIKSDAAMTEDLVSYNIIPLDAPTIGNVITSFGEVSSFILLVIEYSHL